MWKLTQSHMAQLDFLDRIFNRTFQNALVEIRRDLGVPDDAEAAYVPGVGFQENTDNGVPLNEQGEICQEGDKAVEIIKA